MVELTNKQKTCLFLMAKGYSNKEIADKMGIKITTVISHVQGIYERLSLFLDDTYGEKTTMRVRAVLWYLKEYKNGKIN